MKYFETGYITKRELYDALKLAGGLAPWNPLTEPNKIQAGINTSPGSFVLQENFSGVIDDIAGGSKGTIVYFFKETQRWGVISGSEAMKGVFSTLTALQNAYPSASDGDYAFVTATDTYFNWENSAWANTGSGVAPDSLRSTNNLSDVSSKSGARANLSVYSKAEVDTELNKKADKVVGAITGNYPALDSNGNLVDSNSNPASFEPVDFNILRRQNVVDNLTSTATDLPLSAKQGKALQDNKVEKVVGKGLSTNDFNNDYKAQLDNFVENSQDAVGGILTDTDTIDLNYNDNLSQITADIKDNSITDVKIKSDADIATSKLKQATISPNNAIASNNDTQEQLNNKFQGQLNEKAPRIDGEPNGFIDATQISLSWSEATRTLTISKTGTDFSFYANGVKYTKNANETIQISNTVGNHFIYFDNDGVLKETTTFSEDLITRKCYVAFVYWTGTQSLPDCQIETHGCEWASEIHLQQHLTIGTKYESGLALSLTADGDGSSNTHIQLAGATGIIWDEDIKHTITSRIASDTLPIIYRTGASGWDVDKSGSFITKKGANRAYFNEKVGSDYQLTELTNNNLAIAYVYVAPSISNKWFVVMGQEQYANINNARAGAGIAPNLGGLPLQEFKLIGAVIYQSSDSYTNTAKARVVSIDGAATYVDWRQIPAVANNASSTSSDIVYLQNQIDAKVNKTDFANAIKLYVSKTGSDINDGTLIKPFATIQRALNAVPVATDSATSRTVYLIHIATGTYDETLTIDIARKRIILLPDAGVKLGSFNSANWSPTTGNTGRSIVISASLSSIDSIRPLFGIVSNNNTNSGTHQAYVGGFQISGNIILTSSVSLSGEILLTGFTAFGFDGTTSGANPSINAIGWSGNLNLYLERSRFYGEIQGVGRLQNARDCRFDKLITVATYSNIVNSEINAGMTWTIAPSEVQPVGIYNSRLVGAFTGNTNINLLVDASSNYSFIANSATLGANTKKIVIGSLGDVRQESTRLIEKTYGSDNNDGLTIFSPFQTAEKGWTDVNPSGQVKLLGGAEYIVNHTFASSKQSIKTILDNGAKISGTINLVVGNTSMQFFEGKISATINDGSTGTCYFNNVDLSGATLNLNNGGYKYINNSSSAPALINLADTSSGILMLNNISGAVPISIGAGWTIVKSNTTLAITSKNASSVIFDTSSYVINAVITSQVVLNAVLSGGVSGLYIVNFDAPTGIVGLTRGDIIYRVGGVNLIINKFADAPSSLSVVNGSGLDTWIKQGVNNWGVASISSTNRLDASNIADGSISNTEFQALNNITQNIQTQLNNKLETALKGANNGLAELGSDGKVPSSQLPAYVDDVLEFDNLASFPATGEAGKIYIAKDTNITYRWSGSQYVEISSSLALGETASTAYRGDQGKIAYDHSQTTGNPHGTTKADVGLGSVDNTSDLSKPISTATQNALNLKVNKADIVDNLTSTATDLPLSAKQGKVLSEGKIDNTVGIFTVQASDPSTPASGKVGFYSKNGKFYSINDAGAVSEIGASVVDGNKINVIATDIASASTVNLDNATGEIVNITGSTTIATITLSAGLKRYVRFTGVLTLSHGANLVLPTANNITTANGDTALLVGYAGNVVRCLEYSRANGTPLAGGGGDTISAETSSIDNQLVLFSGMSGKLIKKSTDNGFAKLVGGQVQAQTGIGGADISIAPSTLNNILAVGSSGSIVDSGKKFNDTNSPTTNDIWSGNKAKAYVDASSSSDTVTTYSIATGAGQNLTVGDKFAIITALDGDCFVNLPSAINNSGKIIKIQSASASIGRLFINGSVKGTSKYYILSDDNAVFECDGTNWRLMSGPNYKVPFLGSGRQNGGRGFIFALDEKIMGVGLGDQFYPGHIYSPTYQSNTPTQFPILDTDGSIYTGTITGWKEILCSHESAIALTNEGEVFVWGAFWARSDGGRSRWPRKISFPAGIVIDNVYMPQERNNQNHISFYALTTTGKLYAWGNNTWGQLGIGNQTNQNTPALITTLQNKVITKFSVSGNYGMFCGAIDNTGQLYTWGYPGDSVYPANGNSLGTGLAPSASYQTTPYTVSGFTNCVDVACIGSFSSIAGATFRGHTRVLRADGSSWATGYNVGGNLALNNTTGSIYSFTREATSKTNIGKITGGSHYAHGNSCIITNESNPNDSYRVYFAGSNGRGIFGRGDGGDSIQFTLNATQLSAGFQGKMYDKKGIVAKVKIMGHNDSDLVNCFIVDGDGDVYASGYNNSGYCGDGTTTDRNTFGKIKVPTKRRAVDIMPIGWQSESTNRGLLIVFEDGTMTACGNNGSGALGIAVKELNYASEYMSWVVGFSPIEKNNY